MKMNNIAVLIVILFFFAGCNSTSSSENDNRILYLNGDVGSNTHLYNQVIEVTAQMISNGGYKEMLLNKGQIDSTGKFKLFLLPISENFLRPIGTKFLNKIGKTIISDTLVKLSWPLNFGIFGNDSKYYVAGYYGDVVDNKFINRLIEFTYCSNDVSIFGRDSIVNGNDISVVDYNIKMKKGWNKLVHYYYSGSSIPGYSTFYYSLYADNEIVGKWLVSATSPSLPPNQRLKLTL